MADPAPSDLKGEELAEILREVRERVRARHPESATGGLPLPDLMPAVHARDAALGKIAAIGTVNPRPPGLRNQLIQGWKRLLARVLDWHVREQVEFNRAAVSAVDALLEALAENNRLLAALAASQAEQQRAQAQALAELAQRTAELSERWPRQLSELSQRFAGIEREFGDMRTHWVEWRAGWEQKLAATENQFLRSVADLHAGFQHRTSLMESNVREVTRSQHAAFTTQLGVQMLEVQKRVFGELSELQQKVWSDVELLQKRMWSDLERMRGEMERTVHGELRLIRQRGALPGLPEQIEVNGHAAASAGFDTLAFAERFRGSEECVRERQRYYVRYFEGCRAVMDLGCGRGEFLEVMREAGIEARGVDLNAEAVAICREKNLAAETGDLFASLAAADEGSLDGIFSAQVIEHLPPERLPELIRLAAAKLAHGGKIAIETPNPECLAIFATHFYLDPTHRKPVPPALLSFYLQEAGFGRIRVERLSPAVEAAPALASLPEEFREAFFGGLDYAVLASKV